MVARIVCDEWTNGSGGHATKNCCDFPPKYAYAKGSLATDYVRSPLTYTIFPPVCRRCIIVIAIAKGIILTSMAIYTPVAIYSSFRIVSDTTTAVCVVYDTNLRDFVRPVSNSTYSNYYHTCAYLTTYPPTCWSDSRPKVIISNCWPRRVHSDSGRALLHYYPAVVCTSRLWWV